MPPKKFYLKSHLSINQQINKLQSNGIIFDGLTKSQSEHYLSHLNYYRLSAYWKAYPRKRGLCFKRVLDDYFFDKAFRLLVISAIESIEVSLRTQISYMLTEIYGTHPHLKSDIFDSKYDVGKLKAEYQRSNEDFARYFKENYKESLPPLWVMVELMSLGQLSQMYKNIKRRKDRNAISAKYGLDSSILQSYIHQLTIIRNISAHHGRLWNRRFTFNIKIPKNVKYFSDSIYQDGLHIKKRGKEIYVPVKKIYNSLVFLKYMLDIIEPLHDWDFRLKEIIEKYGIDVHFMGFPKDWEKLPVWRRG
jgi:abortive infection bacteriophage resistance protein